MGLIFLKRLLKKIDLLDSIQQVEERFLPDGDKGFLVIVLESLQKGQKVQVKKVNALQPAQS